MPKAGRTRRARRWWIDGEEFEHAINRDWWRRWEWALTFLYIQSRSRPFPECEFVLTLWPYPYIEAKGDHYLQLDRVGDRHYRGV